MFVLDEQSRMVEKLVRQWCTARLAPQVAAMEAGTVAPFALMKELARTFGLAAMADGAVDRRIAKLRAAEVAGEAPPESRGAGALGGEPMMAAVFIKELSRVSPGFAMGWGVSVGLAGGAIVGKGTAAQVERWGRPLVTTATIGAWCLTEPGAGSDAFGSMTTTARPVGDGYVLDGSSAWRSWRGTPSCWSWAPGRPTSTCWRRRAS